MRSISCGGGVVFSFVIGLGQILFPIGHGFGWVVLRGPNVNDPFPVGFNFIGADFRCIMGPTNVIFVLFFVLLLPLPKSGDALTIIADIIIDVNNPANIRNVLTHAIIILYVRLPFIILIILHIT